MKHHIILTHSQWIGIILILLILIGIFIGLHFLPKPPVPAPVPVSNNDSIVQKITTSKKAYYDSLRAVKTAYYDSLRLVRRDSLFQVYTIHQDSMKQADSIFWDSVFSCQPHTLKIDTILELNSADTTELKLIRGIGSSMARKIVRYREQLGGYSCVEQLLDDGLYLDQYGHSTRSWYCLSDSVFPAFTVCLDSIHPIAINYASVQRLQAHPYISFTLAKEIYSLRRSRLTLKNIDELRDLPHMSDSLLIQLTPYLQFDK